MTAHVVEEIPDLLLGGLDSAARAAVEAHLADCPECTAVYADFVEVHALLATGLPKPAPAHPGSPAVRARVLESCAGGRLHRFAGHISALFCVDDARARALLDDLDDASGWEPALLPGSFHRLVGVDDTRVQFFIRVPAGDAVPLHRHQGQENTLVLQGRLVDNAGGVWLPGEQMPKDTGTQHSFRADGRVDLVCGVVMENGVTLVF